MVERGKPVQRRHVNRSVVAAGVLVLAVAGLLGQWAFKSQQAVELVWTVSRDLPSGHVIGADDLVQVAVPASLDLDAMKVDELVEGRVSRVPIAKGAVLPSDALLDVDRLANESEVGVLLKPGRAPVEVSVGAEVLLVDVSEGDELVLSSPVRAVVVEVRSDDNGLGRDLLVTLRVPDHEAVDVARAAAAGNVTLVLSGAVG